MYVRVRPLNDAERERGQAWKVEGNGVFQVRAAARLGAVALPSHCSAHQPASFCVPPQQQVDPASEARVSDSTYKLDAIFDGGQPTAAVYEQTTQGLIHQARAGRPPALPSAHHTAAGGTAS